MNSVLFDILLCDVMSCAIELFSTLLRSFFVKVCVTLTMLVLAQSREMFTGIQQKLNSVS